MDIEKIESDYIEWGFSFDVGVINAGDGVNEAVHDDKHELVTMENGKYQFIIDSESFFQGGCVEVLIPAGAKHSIKNIGINNSKIYYGYKPINN